MYKTKIKRKICECGDTFTPRNSLEKYCSFKCYREFSQSIKTVKKKTCAICGNPFTPFNSIQKHCSWVCIKKADDAKPVSNRMKPKSNDLKKLEARAITVFNKWVKLRDTNKFGWGLCIVSTVNLKYGTLAANAGHFYSVNEYPNLRFNEDNVHLQSRESNFYDEYAHIEYRKNLIIKLGKQRVEELDRSAALYKRTNDWKPTAEYYEEIIAKYTPLVKQLLKSKEL